MNAISWFEIPAADFDRAVNFYNRLLDTTVRTETFANEPTGVFKASEESATGAIVKAERLVPSTSGTLVYLNTETVERLDTALTRVAQLGGSVVQPKTDLGAIGYIAIIRDSEGNNVGLHTDK